MKIIKALFSRFTLISLSIILQVAFFLVLVALLNEYYIYFNIGATVLSIIALLSLLNKNGNPNHKIPWMIVVLLLPPFGLLIYIMFGKGYVSRKHRRLYQSTIDRSNPYLVQKEEVINNLINDKPEYCRQSEYIKNTSRMPIYENTDIVYFATGEEYFKHLFIDLEKAEHFIFLEYFIIGIGDIFTKILKILIEKVKQGVDVRIIYDDMGSIKSLPYRYDVHLRRLGIKCVKFNHYLPIASAVHNNRDHRKIAVIDGYIGYTGGMNLADEYANIISRFGYWKDTGVRLYGEAVKNFTIMFLSTFEVYSNKTDDYSKFMPNVYQKEPCDSKAFVQPFGDGPAPVYSHNIGQNVYMNMINQAQKYIYITTPYLIVDYNMTNSLMNAALRGVEVIIVTPSIPDKKIIFTMTRASYAQLISAGVKIYEYTPGFIHAKNVIVDDEIAVVGTINFDYRSLVHHFECGCYIIDNQTTLKIKDDFLNILEQSKQPPKKYYKKRSILWRVYISVLEFFAPLA